MLDEKTPYEESYRDLIIDEHRDKPKFMLTVDAVLKYNTDIYSVAVYLDDDFDLDESTGAQEDILGELVGEKRELDFQPLTQETPILNDDDFRVLLKSKIAKNHWDGTVDNLQEIWKSLFDENIKITDNQDMTMDVTIDNVPSSVVHEMIYRGKIIPKPQSVGIKYNFVRHLDSELYFGEILGQHKKNEVRQSYAHGSETDGAVYLGGILQKYKKYTCHQKFTQGNVANGIIRRGGSISEYRTHTVNNKFTHGGVAL